MRGHVLWWLAIAGCTAMVERSTESPEDEVSQGPAAVVPDAPATVPLRRTAGVPRTCPVEPGPRPTAAAAPSPPPADAVCRPIARRVRRSLASEARKRWFRDDDASRLEISFACDRLGRIDELAFDSSNGHGFSLDLVRLRRTEHDEFEISILEYVGAPYRADADHWEQELGSAKVKAGVVPASAVEPFVDRARAAASVRVVEHAPPPPEGTLTRVVGGTFTTNDFHVVMRRVDERGYGEVSSFAGYHGSSVQATSLPLMMASGEVWALLGSPTVAKELVVRDPTATDRDLFAERFAAARDRTPAFEFWYVRERYMKMARTLGDARLVPDLVDLARRSGGVSVDRTRVGAINALVAVLGWDPRYDDTGNARPVGVTAAELAAACGSGSSSN